jgi:hypothetical protein
MISLFLKRHTFSHMPNLQVLCTLKVFAMELPLLPLRNTIEVFLTAEIPIEECFPKFFQHIA